MKHRHLTKVQITATTLAPPTFKYLSYLIIFIFPKCQNLMGQRGLLNLTSSHAKTIDFWRSEHWMGMLFFVITISGLDPDFRLSVSGF